MNLPRLVVTGRLWPTEFWLLGIWVGLIAIHLTIVVKTSGLDLLINSLVFWLAIWSLLSAKRLVLQLDSDLLSSIVGIGLITLILLKSQFITGSQFLRIFPILSGLGVALLASGFRRLGVYWRELLLLSLLAIPPAALYPFVNLSALTAQFAATLLWYCGYSVVWQGVFIYLPTGGVEVYEGCAGLATIFQLVQLAVVFLLLIPTSRWQKVWVILLAVLVGFVVNGSRVALMAILASSETQDAFQYWHTGTGSLIFSTIAVLLFGCCCFVFLRQPVLASDWTSEQT